MSKATIETRRNAWPVVLSLLLGGQTTRAATTFPAGPIPSARAPAAVAYHPSLQRAFVVQRKFYDATDVNNDLLPTDCVSVVDFNSGTIVATINLPASINGQQQGIGVDAARNRVFVTNPDAATLSIIDAITSGVITNVAAGSAPTDVAVDPAVGRVYVANRLGVAWFDASTGLPQGNLVVSNGLATALAVDPGNHQIYVGASLAPKLLILDGTAWTITGQVASVDGIVGGPSSVAVDPGYRAYVCFPGANTIAVIDLSGPSPVELTRFSAGNQPNAVAADPNAHRVYVTVPSDHQVRVFTSSGTLVTNLPLRFPTRIAIDPGSSQALVTGTLSDTLTVLNTSSTSVSRSIALGTLDFGLACAPASGRVYAANFAADAVSVLDATKLAYVTNWACGPAPWAVAADEANQQIYTLNGDGTVSVLSASTGQLKANLKVGANLRSIMLSPNTRRAFVTSDSGLTVLDSVTNGVITNLVTGLKPAGVAVDEANHRIYVANQLSGWITLLDASSYATIANWLPVRSNVWALALDAPAHRLYVTVPPPAYGGFNGLEILDANTGAFLGEVPTGGTSLSDQKAGLVAVDTLTHLAYMTEPDNNLIYVLEGTNLLTTVAVGNVPHGISVDESRGLVFAGNSLDGTVTALRETDLVPTRITQLVRSGNQITVYWTGPAGDVHQLQSSAVVRASSWIDVGPPITAGAAISSATDAFDPVGSRFYRVRRLDN